jgi:hypothetical protein
MKLIKTNTAYLLYMNVEDHQCHFELVVYSSYKRYWSQAYYYYKDTTISIWVIKNDLSELEGWIKWDTFFYSFSNLNANGYIFAFIKLM